MMRKFRSILMFLLFLVILNGCESEADQIDLSGLDIISDQVIYDDETKNYTAHDDIDLIDSYLGIDITWASSNTTYITTEGIITRPTDVDEVSVVLTAHIDDLEKSFHIKVKSVFFQDDVPTYHMIYELNAANNGKQIEKSKTYQKYSIQVVDQLLRASYVLKGETDTITEIYPLHETQEEHVYSNDNNDYLIYIDQSYIEMYDDTSSDYEVIIFQKENHEIISDLPLGLYQRSRENLVAYSYNYLSSYWDTVRITFEEDSFSLTITEDLYNKNMTGTYVVTNHFILLSHSNGLILMKRDGDVFNFKTHWLYYPNGYQSVDIDMTLTMYETSIPIDKLNFDDDDSIVDEYKSYVENLDYYSIVEFNHLTDFNVMLGAYINGNILAIKNEYDIKYIQLDNTLNETYYHAYQLNSSMDKAYDIDVYYDLDYMKLDDFFNADIFTYESYKGQVYLKTTAYAYKQYFNVDLGVSYGTKVIIKVIKRNLILSLEFYKEDLSYMGSNAYYLGQEAYFDMDSFETTHTNQFVSSIKPMTLGYSYDIRNDSSNRYIFKLNLEPGRYQVTSDMMFYLTDKNGDILDIQMHYTTDENNYYFEIDEPLDAYLFSTEYISDSSITIDKLEVLE